MICASGFVIRVRDNKLRNLACIKGVYVIKLVIEKDGYKKKIILEKIKSKIIVKKIIMRMGVIAGHDCFTTSLEKCSLM
jgi:hypothetical protein